MGSPLTLKTLPSRFFYFLGRVHFTMILLLGGAAVMVVGTIVESRNGRDEAFALIYGTAWFDFFLFMIVVNLVVAVINRIPIRPSQWPFVLTHFSIVLLLFGCWISRTWGYEGRLMVYEGSESNFIYQDGEEIRVDWWGAGAADARTSGAQSASFDLPRRSVSAPVDLQESVGDQPGVRLLRKVERGIASRELRATEGKGAAGVEFVIGGGRQRSRQWLFAGDPRLRKQDLGPVEVELLVAPDWTAYELLTAVEGERSGATAVVIQPGGGAAPVRIELPEGIGRDIPLGDGRIAKVALYAPHARVSGGRVIEDPSAPPNPAVEVEIRAGDRSERRTAFANYPDYRSDHSAGAAVALVEKVRLEVGGAGQKPRLTLVLAPDGTMRLAPNAGFPGQQALSLPVGEVVRLPGIGGDIQVTRVLLNAATEVVVTPTREERPDARTWVQVEAFHAGERQRLWLALGMSDRLEFGGRQLHVEYGQARREIPFTVALHQFELEHHPGSNRPAEYSSLVDVTSADASSEPRRVLISMNRPLDHEGFRLFQSSYKLGEGGGPDATILSVSYDPGVAVVYPAFVLLVLGIAWYVKRNSGRVPTLSTTLVPNGEPQQDDGARPVKSEVKKMAVRSSVGVLVTCLFSSFALWSAPASAAGASVVPVEETADWAILADGRAKPLYTFAKEVALSVTGRLEHDGLTPLEFLWGYALAPEDFKARPYIRVDSLVLKNQLGLDRDQRRFAFTELLGNAKFRPVVSAALDAQAADRELDPLKKGALEAYAKVSRLAALMDGSLLTIVPIPDANGAWMTPVALREAGEPAQKEVAAEFGRLAVAYANADAASFRASAQKLGAALRSLDPALYPSEAAIDRELFSERLNAFGMAWKFYMCAAIFMIVLGFAEKRWIHWTGIALLLAGFAAHTAGIGLRWSIAGRAPVSNMYESLVFMGWGISALALVQEVVHRNRYFALAGALMGFVCLALSENLPIDSNINPLVPVLAHTSWLAIHVMTIMVSYSAFALAMALAHVALLFLIIAPEKEDRLFVVSMLTYKTLQVGLLFLGAGIICGAVWANESWGRYWGWDPKETWSLITFFVYLAIIHARHAGWILDFGVAASSILGFLSVIMTYYGVNYILAAGMHSYGFSEGGQYYMLAFALFESGFVAGALLINRQRERRRLLAAAE